MSYTETLCENTEGDKLYKNMRFSEPSLLASIKKGLETEVSKERRAHL